MKYLLRKSLCLFLCFLAFSCLAAERGPEPSYLKIGAAEIDITPPPGHRMAGYFDERLATGVHDPLKAKALVIQQANQKFALVFCDLVGLSLNVTTNARAQASQQTAIPVSNIVISATHSHTGPLFDDVRRYYFHEAAVARLGADPQEKIYYPKFLTERVVQAIAAGDSSLRPAHLEVGIAKQEGLTFNRRYWMKNGKVAFNPGQMNSNIVRPAGPSDSDVGILLAMGARAYGPGAVGIDSKQKPFAGATIFALHSDTVGGTEYSADYAYYLQQKLRSAFGQDYISAFGAGTCGDLNHINVNKKEPIKGNDVAEHLGTTLGQTVLLASSTLARITQPALAVRNAIITAALQEPTPEQVAEAHSKIGKIGDPNTDFMTKVLIVKTLDLEQRGKSYPLEVQVFRFDADTALVCLPGEIFVELGLAIKHDSPFKRTMVMSICNDRPSYVPTKKAFTEGSYEITNARVTPGTGEQLVETALRLLKELK